MGPGLFGASQKLANPYLPFRVESNLMSPSPLRHSPLVGDNSNMNIEMVPMDMNMLALARAEEGK
jgi:hypothetical protein